TDRLTSLQRDVLVGPGIGVSGDQPEARFRDPRTDPADEGQLPDRRVDRALVHYLLHPVEDRLAPLAVQLLCLLQEHGIEVRAVAIGEGAALGDARLEPGGRVAERAA